MLIEFLKQVTLNNVLASTVKRFGLYAAEYMLVNLVAPAWMATPLRYSLLSATGTASKQLFWWAITPRAQTPLLEEPLVFIGDEESLESLEFVVVNPNESGYTLSFKTINTKIKQSAIAVANGVGNYIVNVTFNDLLEGTGATVGSSVAAGAFVIFMGPPSLLTLPAYFVMEGPIKSFGAFCGRKLGRDVIGEKAAKPALKAFFKPNSIQQGNAETVDDLDALAKRLEQLNLISTEEIIDSFELIALDDEEPLPKAKLKIAQPFEIIDDYDPSAAGPSDAQGGASTSHRQPFRF